MTEIPARVNEAALRSSEGAPQRRFLSEAAHEVPIFDLGDQTSDQSEIEEVLDQNLAWQFFLSPLDAWKAMYSDCAQAARSIEMEQYIFSNDIVGQQFLDLFIQKAREGVHVRLLCDDVGSSSFHHDPRIEEFRKAGGIFHFYNSIKWVDFFKPRQIFPRTHLKALVIDDETGYIGGVCLALRMTHWRDTQIRVTGPVVKQIRSALDRNAQELLGAGGNYTNQIVEPKPSKDQDFTYIQNDPAFTRHPIYQTLLEHIAHAQEYVYLSSAFFIPTRRMRRYLRRAALRGVNVIVLIPRKSESELADLVCLSYLARMIKDGVHIHFYEPVILHTKTAVIDSKWGTVGSCNMDPLSFFHNREANLLVHNKDALLELRNDFLNDLHKSSEMTFSLLKNIPLWKRVVGHLARVFRPIL